MNTAIVKGSAVQSGSHSNGGRPDKAPRRFETPCTITVEQSSDHFHAHVDLPEGIEMEPGDKVRVQGAPISIPFGSKEVFERTAIVTRAGPVSRAVTRLAAYFDLAELYEVSFNAGRIK